MPYVVIGFGLTDWETKSKKRKSASESTVCRFVLTGVEVLKINVVIIRGWPAETASINRVSNKVNINGYSST